MAFKDVLVLLDERSNQAKQYAALLATAFDAHVTAAALAPDPGTSGGFLDDGAAFLIPALEEARHAILQMLEEFATSFRRSGARVETEVFTETSGTADRALGPLARNFDLIVAEQPDPDLPDERRSMIEAVLFASGRPVLVVPSKEGVLGKLENVLVAWDGSATAARAVGDAIPFLARARRVELVTAVDAVDKTAGSSPRIVRHLARHGVEAAFHRLPIADDVASTLLSHASHAAADLMVMGGYGHSRLRERMLGGATRGVLEAMTLPVLMAH